MSDFDDRLSLLESEIERRLGERFAALRDEFERLRTESDRRWEGFLSRFDQDFHGIVPPELFLPPPAPPPPEAPAPPPARERGVLSLEAARTLDGAANQVDTLHRFLDLCREHASRAALLIAKGGGFGVWKAVGFGDHDGDDEAVRRASLPADGELARVLSGTPVTLEADSDVSRRLLASGSLSAILVPMVVKEKVSGAVYADAVEGEQDRYDPESIALLTFLAGLSVDRLASRKLKPAPPLAAPVAAEPARPEVAREAEISEPKYSLVEEASEAPSPGVQPEPPQPPPPPAPAAQAAPEPTPEPSPEAAGEPAPRTAHPIESWKRPTPEVSFEKTQEAPTSAIEFEPETPSEAAHPPDFAASTPLRTSTGARRLAGPLAPSMEGDERRDEARRFARLLVSEIKLYNERAVLEGREHGNLYARLKEDIDRSRQMYDDRIPEDIRANSNFFYEELVRVLADGRADALGM
jgi:hypothetical protein